MSKTTLTKLYKYNRAAILRTNRAIIRSILITKTKTKTKMIAIRLLKLKLELKYKKTKTI